MAGLRDDDPQYEADAKKVFHLMLSSHESWDPVDMANMLDPAQNAVLQGPEKVFRLTFHLITHDKELNVLRFAHLSVREYFETNLSEFSPSKNMEGNVAACFEYLDKTREFEFRPLSYPSKWWFKNLTKLCTGEISAQFADRLAEFLVHDVRTFEGWVEAIQEGDRFLYDEAGVEPTYTILSKEATTVFAACVLGLEDILSRLVDAKPSCIHAKNLEGNSPLVVACEWSRNANIVSLLLQKGAAINERVGYNQSLTALETALSVRNPSIAVIRELLESGADPDCNNMSALLIAVKKCSTEAVELLLQHRANPNPGGGYGHRNPLYAACLQKEGPCEIVKNLLEAGATVKSVGDMDNDALRAAAQSGREDFVKILLGFGANVNALDEKRETDEKWYVEFCKGIIQPTKQMWQ